KAAMEQEMGSSFSGHPELPWRTDRAMGTEWSCPICHDEREGVAYVIPCGHEFCMGCILRWAEKKPECPLCRRLIESVRFSLQEQKYLECSKDPQSPRALLMVPSPAGNPAAAMTVEEVLNEEGAGAFM
uniref:RING-type domain-containing protein n=1 Tax=Cyanistes caeruleus TaxID=156563 RepID=A0A8C0ZAQ1_CYACU